MTSRISGHNDGAHPQMMMTPGSAKFQDMSWTDAHVLSESASRRKKLARRMKEATQPLETISTEIPHQKTENLHGTDQKDNSQGDLSSRISLQLPHNGERKYEHNHIVNNVGQTNPAVVAELVNASAVELLVPLVGDWMALKDRNQCLTDTPEPDICQKTVCCVSEPGMDAEKSKIEQ